MKKCSYILGLCLLACRPEMELREVIVTATFQSDASPVVHLFYADNLSPVSDAHLSLQVDDEQVSLPWDGLAYTQANRLLEAQDTLQLTCDLDGYSAKAYTRIPPAIDIISISNTQITINPGSTGAPALVIQWSALPTNQFSYLLKLENLDANPESIPFTVPAGRFEEQYSGPLSQTGTILFDTDFKEYGNHRLTIFAIRKDFEDLFFYSKTDLRGLALLSPDNIEDAKGFVTAISSTSVDLIIQ